ncbi:GNAT family N-acetyltransferase [Thermoproteota archaeon]
MNSGCLVKIRPLIISDLEEFTKWHGDDRVMRFLGMTQLTDDASRHLLESYLDDKNGVYFGIEYEDKLIGYTFLKNILKNHKVAREFGIVIGEPLYWDHGYGTEASRMIVEYGFKVLGLHRIELLVLDFNERAQRVYEKLGFAVEGRQRQARLVNNEWCDLIVMAKLN